MIAASLVAWLWMAAQSWNVPGCHESPPGNLVCDAVIMYPVNEPKVGQIMQRCGKPHNGIQDYCWVYPPKPKSPAEHVIEIRTRREDKKAAIGVDRPGSPCNVNDGQYLTCTTAPITHWHCADADHVLEGGFDEVLIIDPEHPNKPYCVRVTREIYVDNKFWGILKETQ